MESNGNGDGNAAAAAGAPGALGGDAHHYFPGGSDSGAGRHALDSKLLSSIQRPSLADRRRSSRTSLGPYALRNSSSFSSSSNSDGVGAGSDSSSSHHGYSPEALKKIHNFPPAPAAASSYAAQIQSQSWLGVQGHYQPDAAYAHAHSRSSSFSSVASDLSSASAGSSWSETEYPSCGSFDAAAAGAGPAGNHTDAFQQQANHGHYAFPPPTVPSNATTATSQQPSTMALPMLTSHTGMMHISPPPPNQQPQNHQHQHQQTTMLPAVQLPFPVANAGQSTTQGEAEASMTAYANILRTGTLTNSQAEKVRVAFVHTWLQQSFHQHPEGNVSRQGLYTCYLNICSQYAVNPMNAASYGKAVRSCWPGIKTRRLGVRGQSRYHFCGVRPSSKEIEDMLAVADAQSLAAPPSTAAGSAADTSSGNAAPGPGLEAAAIEEAPESMSSSSSSLMGADQNMATVPLTLPNLLNPRNSISPAGSANARSTFSSPIEFQKERMQSYDSYDGSSSSSGKGTSNYGLENDAPAPVFLPVTQINYGPPGLEPPPSTSGLRRQVSAPSLINVPSPQGNANGEEGGNNSMADFSFPDLKTPTAPAFVQPQYQYQQNHGHLQTGAYSFGTAGASMSNSSGSQGVGLGEPSVSAGADYLKGRRATVPNLQITIPPLHGGPASSHPLRPLHGQGPLKALPSLRETAGLPDLTESKGHFSAPKIILQLPSFEDVLAEVHMLNGAAALGAQHAHNLQASLRTLDKSAAAYLWNCYKTEHCQVLLRLFAEGRYAEFGHATTVFWTSLTSDHARIVQHPVMSQAMMRADTALYGALLDHLRAELLQSTMEDVGSARRSHSLSAAQMQQLKSMSEKLECYVAEVLKSERFDVHFSSNRIELTSRVAHLMDRHLGLVQLTQALQDVFASGNAKEELLSAWATLDLEGLTNQTALVTSCTQQTVNYYLEEFRAAVAGLPSSASSSETATGKNNNNDSTRANPIKAFADFAEHALSFAVAGQQQQQPPASQQSQTRIDIGSQPISEARAKDFLVKWSFVAGQVLRDLTISSNPAFGSFQVISLFIQEWLSFAVLKDAALHANAVSASIAAESGPDARQLQLANQPMHMPAMQGMLFTDPASRGQYLVSPSGMSFANNGPSGPLRSARSTLHPLTAAAHPAGFPSSAGFLSATGMTFNLGSALTPTTRALFANPDQKSPFYLNFASHFPPTPSAALFGGSAMAMQRSPALRSGFPYTSHATQNDDPECQGQQPGFPAFSVDDFSLPPPSPGKGSIRRSAE